MRKPDFPYPIPMTEWNTRFCTLSIQYKSGTVIAKNGMVDSMRERALQAIRRKGACWIKVSIADPATERLVICIWDNDNAWVRYSVKAP